jgi:hypothetical protein
MPLTWALWTFWAFCCAMAIRITVVRFFRPALYPIGPYLAAYLSWAALFGICMGLAIILGFKMDGAEARPGPHHLGYVIAYFSPFGLPLLGGAPLVLVLDLAMSASRWFVGPKRGV